MSDKQATQPKPKLGGLLILPDVQKAAKPDTDASNISSRVPPPFLEDDSDERPSTTERAESDEKSKRPNRRAQTGGRLANANGGKRVRISDTVKKTTAAALDASMLSGKAVMKGRVAEDEDGEEYEPRPALKRTRGDRGSVFSTMPILSDDEAEMVTSGRGGTGSAGGADAGRAGGARASHKRKRRDSGHGLAAITTTASIINAEMTGAGNAGGKKAVGGKAGDAANTRPSQQDMGGASGGASPGLFVSDDDEPEIVSSGKAGALATVGGKAGRAGGVGVSPNAWINHSANALPSMIISAGDDQKELNLKLARENWVLKLRAKKAKEYEEADKSSKKGMAATIVGLKARIAELEGNAENDGQLYCYCQDVESANKVGLDSGEWEEHLWTMVECGNEGCEYQWFHLGCLGLDSPPEGDWLCPGCEELK